MINGQPQPLDRENVVLHEIQKRKDSVAYNL